MIIIRKVYNFILLVIRIVYLFVFFIIGFIILPIAILLEKIGFNPTKFIVLISNIDNNIVNATTRRR